MTIPHELAKQLKDAGFKTPEKYTGMNVCTPCKNHPISFDDSCTQCEWIYYPTLEELIEACGEKIESCNQLKEDYQSVRAPRGVLGGWEITTIYEEDKNDWIWGPTFKVAAARVWLALNPK